MSRDIIYDQPHNMKINDICVWEVLKDRVLKLAVRMAVIGNVLTMLASNESDEHDAWKFISGEHCIFDYKGANGNWFTTIDHFSTICKVCGNDKQGNDFI